MTDEEALVKAAFNGDVESVRRLLDAGVSVEAANDNWNALHAAIENQEFECVRLLVERGADVETDECGMSPLAHAVDIACDSSHQLGIAPEDARTDIVEYLLSAGAKPETAVGTAHAYASEKFVHLLQRSRRVS